MKPWRFALAVLSLGGWVGFCPAQDVGLPVQLPIAPVQTAAPPVVGGLVVDGPVAAEGDVGQSARDSAHPLATWIGLAKAQSGYGVPGQVFYPHTQTAPPPATPPTAVGPAQYVPPNYPHLDPEPGNPRPVRNNLQRIGVGCWSHHNLPTCSSLRSELTFVFGSCRAFFSEPCLHGPPPVPLPGTPGERTPALSLAPMGILSPIDLIPIAAPVVIHP